MSLLFADCVRCQFVADWFSSFLHQSVCMQSVYIYRLHYVPHFIDFRPVCSQLLTMDTGNNLWRWWILNSIIGTGAKRIKSRHRSLKTHNWLARHHQTFPNSWFQQKPLLYNKPYRTGFHQHEIFVLIRMLYKCCIAGMKKPMQFIMTFLWLCGPLKSSKYPLVTHEEFKDLFKLAS